MLPGTEYISFPFSPYYHRLSSFFSISIPLCGRILLFFFLTYTPEGYIITIVLVKGAVDMKCQCRYKSVPRTEEEKKALRSRLNRIIGQLGGIGNMIDDDRYCGDILIQISAAEKALHSLGRIIMKNHLDTCVTEQVKKGNTAIMDEVMELFDKLG